MKLAPKFRLMLCAVPFVMVPVAMAQGELWRFSGLYAAAAGDPNLDGHPDFLVLSRVGSSSSVTRAEVRSGADGSVLVSYTTTAPFAALETPRALGDLDGDGRDDFGVVEQRTTGATVLALSGATGQVLYEVGLFSFDHIFSSLERLDDVDGDGRPDYAIGVTVSTVSPQPWPGGEVWIVSGATGNLIRMIFGPPSIVSWGMALSRFDDLDGDGLHDLAVGAMDRAEIVSVGSGAVLFSVTGSMPQFGSALARIDDVDGDGRSELAVGAPGPTTAPTLATTCGLFVYSVPSGALLRQWDGVPNQRRLGHHVASAGDFDGDGLGDVMYAAGHGQTGCCSLSARWVEIASVATGNVLYLGPRDDSASLDTLGDIDGDGTVDYIVGGYYFPDSTFGTSVMLTGAPPPTWAWPCAPLGAVNTNSLGCAPAMGCSGAPSLSTGDPFSLAVRQFRNRVSAAMISSAGSAPGIPFAQQALCLAGPRQFLRVANTGGSATGNDCTGALDVPLSHASMAQFGWTAGSVVTVQCWARDPGFVAHSELSLSDALSITIWP